MIQFSEIDIKKIHKKSFMAAFKMWDDKDEDPLKVDVEFYAPTKERLEFKIGHLKETGIFLRD